MDSFLNEMSTDGEYHSEGVFSIDISKAKLKLAQYQLAQRALFPNFLMAAATASGAHGVSVSLHTEVEIFRRHRVVMIVIHGLVLTREQLQRIGFASLKGSGEPYLPHLAVVMSTLGGVKPITVVSTGERECEVSIRAGTGEIEDITPRQEYVIPNTTVIVYSADVLDVVAYRFRAMSHLCSARLETTDKTGVQQYPQGLSALNLFPLALGVYWNPVGFPLPFNSDGLAEQVLAVEGQRKALPQILIFDPASRLGLWFLVNGLMFRCDIFEGKEIHGVIVADHLKADISWQNLVQNDSYQEVVQELRTSLAILLEVVLRQVGTLEQHHELALHRMIVSLESHFDCSRLFELLERRSRALYPVASFAAINRLRSRLPRMSREIVEGLFEQYRHLIQHLWVEGKFAQAESYLKAYSQLLPADHPETFIVSSLSGYFKELPTQHTTLPPEDRVGELLCFYNHWSRNPNSCELPRSKYSGIHPSWTFPVAFAKAEKTGDWDALQESMGEYAPEWLQAWRLLRTGEVTKALGFLRNSLPEYRSSRREWLHLVWEHFKGTLTWPETIRLRVELSALTIIEHEDFEGRRVSQVLETLGLYIQASNYAEAFRQLTALARNSLADPGFWPGLLLLLRYADRSEEATLPRVLWASAVKYRLLHLALTRWVADPLDENFFEDPEEPSLTPLRSHRGAGEDPIAPPARSPFPEGIR